MIQRKGIILAGGTGSRLAPITRSVSKQLLPVYNKPMIYHPLSTLIEAGIDEIAIISSAIHLGAFRRLLGDGSQLGLKLKYIVQPSPDGIAQAYILAERFLDCAPSALILGDNLFWGGNLPSAISRAAAEHRMGTIFTRPVPDAHNYGVVTVDAEGRPKSIIEKPELPPSNRAVTGLYFLDGNAPRRARAVRPSTRGELEITSLLQGYADDGLLRIAEMNGDCQWFDTGNPDTLFEASQFVFRQSRNGYRNPGCIEEAAFLNGLISARELAALAETYGKTEYAVYLRRLAIGEAQIKPVEPQLSYA